MKYYHIEIKPSARKSLAALPRRDQVRLASAIDGLHSEPRPQGVSKLAGEESLWRIRVGEYRVVYSIEDKILTIQVIRIGHRRDVYR